MEVIKGKFAKVKVLRMILEVHAGAQLQIICDDPVSEGSIDSVMLDAPLGNNRMVGFTMTVGRRIIPHLSHWIFTRRSQKNLYCESLVIFEEKLKMQK